MSNDDPKYPQVLDSNQCQIDAMLYPNNKDVHEVTALKILVSKVWNHVLNRQSFCYYLNILNR